MGKKNQCHIDTIKLCKNLNPKCTNFQRKHGLKTKTPSKVTRNKSDKLGKNRRLMEWGKCREEKKTRELTFLYFHPFPPPFWGGVVVVVSGLF